MEDEIERVILSLLFYTFKRHGFFFPNDPDYAQAHGMLSSLELADLLDHQESERWMKRLKDQTRKKFKDKEGAKEYEEVEKASAEVATLVDTSSVSLPKIIGHAKGLGVSLGFSQVESVQALYGVISSGQDPANVVETLRAMTMFLLKPKENFG